MTKDKLMPEHLTTSQLEGIQKLIIEPLRSTVRAEMQAGHERLASAIERVGLQLSTHIASTIESQRKSDARIELLDRRVTTLEHFRARILVVYGLLTIGFSLLW